LPVGNYSIKQDQFGNFFLELIDNFTAPKKIYGNILEKADRILSTYLDRPSSTGVMLAGEKGSGKTLLSKHLSIIAASQGIPTIVINNAWCGDAFNQLIQDISQNCIILFDEFEKVYDSEHQEAILTLLDGVFPSKKLFIFTCNDRWRVDKNMRNRPGRIYYMMDFKGLEISFIEEYCQDNLIDKHHTNTVCKISSLFNEFNFDMLKALVEEMNRYRETPQDAMRMLNAKPEFGEKAEYDIQLFINNIPITEEDRHRESWHGNPISDAIEVTYKKKSETDATDYDWETIEFSPTHLVNIDTQKGTFIFTNENEHATVLLSKKVYKTFDYLSAF